MDAKKKTEKGFSCFSCFSIFAKKDIFDPDFFAEDEVA